MLNIAHLEECYRGRRVLVTGDTGFKGSWLTEWLLGLGAEVTGVGLPPATTPALFDILDHGRRSAHREVDLRDTAAVRRVVAEARPQVVFHLAAQALVRTSFREPLQTVTSNVLGTANLLDALGAAGATADLPCAVVVVTSDKCYADDGRGAPLGEERPMGGRDVYSASKGMVELLVAAWRQSLFAAAGAVRIATARAGNVIGGGDWATDRIAVDCVRALARGDEIDVRRPHAVRPWQHVLEPLAGYLTLGARLLAGRDCEDGFNFGPGPRGERTVGELCDAIVHAWGSGGWRQGGDDGLPETATLRLATDKARRRLGWRPTWGFEATIERVVDWYRQGIACGHDRATMTALTQRQIAAFCTDATADRLLVGGGTR